MQIGLISQVNFLPNRKCSSAERFDFYYAEKPGRTGGNYLNMLKEKDAPEFDDVTNRL